MRVRSKDKFPTGHGGIKYCKFMSLNINNCFIKCRAHLLVHKTLHNWLLFMNTQIKQMLYYNYTPFLNSTHDQHINIHVVLKEGSL